MPKLKLPGSVTVHYRQYGRGKPVLFIHGNRDSSRVFDDLIPFFLKTCRVITVDLRGHGKSSVPAYSFLPDDLVNDIYGLICRLELKRVVVIGHSLGSTLAVLLACRHPQLIRKIVLISAAAVFQPQFKRPGIDMKITRSIVRETNKRAAPFFFTGNNRKTAGKILAGWLKLPCRMHEFMIRIKHPDLRRLLSRLTVPVLVIYGRNDRITPVEKKEDFCRYAGQCRVIIIEDAGHFVFMEKPEAVATAILEYLGEDT